MDASLRAFIRDRAGRRCEYCRMHKDDDDFLAFHIEHFIAKQHGGTDDPETLCYACSECNWAKGPNLAGLLDGKLYRLFNPRKQNWNRHFPWKGAISAGKTGKVTVQVLNINDPTRVLLRQNLQLEGRFSPDD